MICVRCSLPAVAANNGNQPLLTPQQQKGFALPWPNGEGKRAIYWA
jgi:hypothetical protein